MRFSENEIRLIKTAESIIKQSYYLRIALLSVLIALIIFFLGGMISPKHLAYASVAIVITSILFPQLGSAPKYEQLVKILSSKCNT